MIEWTVVVDLLESAAARAGWDVREVAEAAEKGEGRESAD